MAQSQDEQSSLVVTCGDVLDVSGVADFKAQLQQQMNENASIVLDAGQVARVDGAGLQLLAVVFQDAQQCHCELSWHNPSESLKVAAATSGLQDVLKL